MKDLMLRVLDRVGFDVLPPADGKCKWTTETTTTTTSYSDVRVSVDRYKCTKDWGHGDDHYARRVEA